jgi:single-strand selective monofunctional uracil DNA glycosylase
MLQQVVAALEPGIVIGVGAFAETAARRALGDRVAIGRIPHPSPASPAANRGWEALVDASLGRLGVELIH